MSVRLPSLRLNKLLDLFHARQFDQLERHARDLSRRYPAEAVVWQMLGVSYLARQRGHDALPHLEHAARLAPDDASIRDNLGLAHARLGEFAAAERQFEQATRLAPEVVPAWVNRSQNALQGGNAEQAEAHARQALALAPGSAEALLNLGNALADQGRWDEAEASYRQAMLCAPPHWIEAALNLANLFDSLSRFTAAVACLEELARNPAADWRVFNALGRACSMLGDTPAALDHYARAIQLNPLAHAAHSGYLYHLMHDADASAEDIAAAHRRFGAHFASASRSRPRAHGNDRDPERPLRIGFVSADLRRHAVAYFMEPMFEALRQRGLTLVAYSNLAREDEVSARLRNLVDRWHRVDGVSDTRLAEMIRADRIDILVDLSGHTAGNRLPLFAHRPAPVQVTWLGYSGTTGMDCIDYRFVFRLTAPPGRLDDQFSEKLVYLPYAMSFKTEKDAPEVAPLPALSRGHLTFGSLNRPSKINAHTIALWARVLRAVPSAHLLIGAVSEARIGESLLAGFDAEGIDRARISLHPRLPTREYLELHNRIDVLLDTFPYAGGTTSNHALWMGVPTLTLAGRTLPQRLGAGIMGKVGLNDWVAESEDEFVAIARRCAADLPALANLRQSLRARLETSPTLSTAKVADSIALAFRLMWRNRCAGQPPQAIELPA
ncbi:tetratricopeptide repeat protein [Zoogloea sp.]|uniref:O-linked N-acetylglucosamine transferase, SPINDLY family protein n=1 Tax=Zoogloea sp. TaxID=49181 RepID=UPI001415D991|nr:MAG: tetratricopeptide repeat protein [Zoogloea sp.]